MKDIFYKLESSWIWGWIKKNASVIVAICAIAGLIISIVTLIPRANVNEKGYTTPERPNIKIKSVYLKVIPYQESGETKSFALKFSIPIRNEGDATAYEVEIKRKELRLVRGQYDLKDSSLQTIYTSSPFYLTPSQTIEDIIFIDESPANMQKVMDGNESFLLTYEIHFYEDRKLKREPYIYEYQTKFSKGQFQVVYEHLHRG